MRSPTCLLESRVYGSKNLRSTVQKDFYNTIGNRVLSLLRTNLVAFGVKRTSITEPYLWVHRPRVVRNVCAAVHSGSRSTIRIIATVEPTFSKSSPMPFLHVHTSPFFAKNSMPSDCFTRSSPSGTWQTMSLGMDGLEVLAPG